MKEGIVTKSLDMPGKEDMEAINRYTRRDYGPEEVYAFAMVLCDNEIDRDYERFSVESLDGLRGLFLGKTCIFDHECRSANQTARIYHTELRRVAGETTGAGEELVQLLAKAYLPRIEGSRGTIELIESGILKEMSVSCDIGRRVCGICGKMSCEHVRGRSYEGKVAHTILMEPSDAYECSFVAVPAQRGAGVVKSAKVEKILAREENEEVTLTKSQVREIGERFREVSEKARWGEKYRMELERGVLKYSAIAQPDMPRRVMESAVKALGVEELAEMERTYRGMAEKALPLRPQLMPRREEGCKDGNRDFLI